MRTSPDTRLATLSLARVAQWSSGGGPRTQARTSPASSMSTKAARLKKTASAKIQHHIGGLRTTIPAQMAVAGPPVATQLGQLGVNIQQFVKDFNLRTSIFREGVPLPTRTTMNPDRSYNLVIHHPTATYFLKQAAGVKRGAMKPGHEITGYITRWGTVVVGV